MGFTKLLSKLSLTILILIKYAKTRGIHEIDIILLFFYNLYPALICILLLLVQNPSGSNRTHATIRNRKARHRMHKGFLKLDRKIELNNTTTTKLSDVYFIHHFLVQILRKDWNTTLSRKSSRVREMKRNRRGPGPEGCRILLA